MSCAAHCAALAPSIFSAAQAGEPAMQSSALPSHTVDQDALDDLFGGNLDVESLAPPDEHFYPQSDEDADADAAFSRADDSNRTIDAAPGSVEDFKSDEAYAAREAERLKKRESLFSRLNPRQAEAVNGPAVSTLILAGAGSGKTSVLTARIARRIEMGTPARSTLAVTFTNKASEEMKVRLRELMDKKTVGDIWVGTFHSLSNKILRENFEAAGLPKSFAILDTDGQEAICRGALKDLGLTKSAVKEAKKLEKAAAQASLLASADPLAGIGNNGGLDAAGALTADDVEDDGEVNEFVTPSQCVKYISSRKEAGEKPHPPTSVNTMSTDVDQMEAVFQMYQERCAKSGLLDFQDLLTKTVDLLEHDALVRVKYKSRFTTILVDEFQDTNDIQYRWLELLKGDNAHVMAVGDDYQSIYGFRGANPENMFRFRDEMTATKEFPHGRIVKLEENYRSLPHILAAANAIIGNNSGQMEKTLFSSKPDSGEKLDVVAFGSDRFEAGAIAKEIHRLVREDKVEPAEIAVLYRTNMQSRLIEQELNKLGVPLTVYGGYRFFERQEVKNVLAYLDLVTDMTRDLSFSRVANIPARGLGDRTIEELRQMAKSRGISMMEMVGERSESMARHPASVGNAAAQKKQRILESFANIIVELSELTATMPLHRVIERVIERTGLKDFYLAEAKNSKASQEEAEDRISNLEELVSAAKQFELDNPELGTGAEQLPEYMAHVALMTSTSESDMSRKNTVSLMTVHSSKGLEFDEVFVSGLEETVFPHSRAIAEDEMGGNGKSMAEAMKDIGTDADDEGSDYVEPGDGPGIREERRLMYVAITRARKRVSLSYARERMVNGEIKRYEPSRFLEEIPAKRVNLIDDAERHADARNSGGRQSYGNKSKGYGNHEYGGDAYDNGRAGRATPKAAAPRTELRKQTAFEDAVLVTNPLIAGAGSVRVVSERRSGVSVLPGEVVVHGDRRHAVLGNHDYVLQNHLDDVERKMVVDAHKADYLADLALQGPMFLVTQEYASRVAKGEKLALSCWCAPRACHLDHVAENVAKMANAMLTGTQELVGGPAGRQIAFIGTAGRDKDIPMSSKLWDAMFEDAKTRVRPDDTAVSGGAAWSDHLAVALYLGGFVKHLRLHLPAPLVNGSFEGEERKSSGSTTNYYHGLFKRITGVDGILDIARAIARGAEVTYEPVANGFGAMRARNQKVATGLDEMNAYTFGEGEVPKDGGTKMTWDMCTNARKTHIALAPLAAAPAMPRPAVVADAAATSQAARSAAPKPWDKPWLRRAPGEDGAALSVATQPSEQTRTRLAGLGRRPGAPRPR
jgi:DNA helicase-2/ATP-dependent DNA helicase PcrA